MLSGFGSAGRSMPPPPHHTPLLASALLLLGSFGIAAAWVLLAQAIASQASWVAVLAAIDAAILLRLGGMRAGWPRAGMGVLGTALAIALANWGIVAAQMGAPMGMLPWESMSRLGPDFVWTLAMLVNGAVDFAWWGAALVVAATLSR